MGITFDKDPLAKQLVGTKQWLGANGVENSDTEKWVYNGYGIIFDSEGSWSFYFFSAGRTYGINGSFGPAEKPLVLTLVNQTKNVAWFCIIMLMIIVISLLMEKKSLSLKPAIKMWTF